MFDADKTFSGGGFMKEHSFSSPSAQKKEQVRRVQNVVPLVARQIHASKEEDFKLCGMPVQIANLVGILRNLEVQSTKASCSIEDHSGTIKGIMWLETEGDSVTALPPVKEGCYVQVFGSIRNQDGERIVMILRMFPVDDCNIITNHLLQVIHTKLMAERMSKGLLEPSKPMGASTSSMSFTDMGNNMASTSSAFTGIQQQVYKILQSSQDNVGVSKENILKRFKPNQEREVSNALDFLLSEGHTYTTIDNHHYKATDG